MVQVACPYCALPMTDDGGMAGCLVMCPRCNGQFQMPGMEFGGRDGSSSQTAELQPATYSAALAQTYRRRPKRSSNLALGVITVGLAGVVAVGAFVFLMSSSDAQKPQEPSRKVVAKGSARQEATSLSRKAVSSDVIEVAAKTDEPKSVSDARAEIQSRIDRYFGGQKDPDLLGAMFAMKVAAAGITKDFENVEIERVSPKYSEDGRRQDREFVATVIVTGTDYKGRPFRDRVSILKVYFEDGEWKVF